MSGTVNGIPYADPTDLMVQWPATSKSVATAIGGSGAPARVLQQKYTRNFNVPAASITGIAPPTTAYATQSTGSNSLDTLTFLKPCLFTLTADCSGFTAGSVAATFANVTHNGSFGLMQVMSAGLTDWGGSIRLAVNFTAAMKAGDVLTMFVRGGGNLTSHGIYTYTDAIVT